MKSYLIAAIAAAAVACPPTALDAAVQGTFVAHVVEVIPPRSELSSTHTFTTPSATLDLPLNFTAVNSSANVTLDEINFQISAPATTPKGNVVGAESIGENSASVEFLAGQSLRTNSSVSAGFTIPDLHFSSPRAVFAYGQIGNSQYIVEQVDRDEEVVTPNSTASVSTAGGASLTSCAHMDGSAFGYPSTTRICASTIYYVGAGYATGSSSWSVLVRVSTLYDFAEVAEPGSLKVVKVVEDCEVRLPGEDWIEAEKDMVLPEGTQISTGPDSELHLRYGDGSVLIVGQMTEALVSILLKQGNAFTAQLLLRAGEIAAQVNPDTRW